jgi:hypothetical protein
MACVVLMWLGADEEFVARARIVSCELGVVRSASGGEDERCLQILDREWSSRGCAVHVMRV